MITINENLKQKLTLYNSYLLIVFGFFLPLSVAITNIIVALITINWLIIGDFKKNFFELKNNKIIIAIVSFILLYFIGLLWTSDIEWGLHMIKKELKLLLIPIFMIFIKKEHIKYYIIAFLLAISISEFISYLIWFDLIEPFKNATKINPTPFMSHISYNPFLVIGVYLLSYYVLFDKAIGTKKKFLYTFFIVSMSINIFITGGRAGQVMYFFMIMILFIQYYNKNIIKAILIGPIIISMIFFTAYNSSKLFKDRVDRAYVEIIDYENNKNSSVGLRIVFTINSLKIIKDNLLLGIGTGDFKKEYKNINEANTPSLPNTVNPHNMYILILVQFGLVGLIIFLSIFYYQIKYAINSNNNFIKKFGLVLPFLYLVIMFSDSYLLGHYTTMLFVFFSAILYKNEKNEYV